MSALLPRLLHATELVVVYYFFLLNGVYIFLSLVAFREVYRHLLRSIYGGYEQLSRSPLTPPISVIVPAHNEEVGIVLTVNNLLHIDYMRFEVIIVNDGSTDETLEELRKAFALAPSADKCEASLETQEVLAVYKSPTHPNLTVIDKKNGGKADALNSGLNAARYAYFCSIDADAVLEADALQRVVLPIMESPKRVIGVGGIIRVANGCRIEKGRVVEVGLSANPLPVFQVVEYCRAFLCGRTGFSRFNALMIISGAFGLFETDLVKTIGGYRTGTVGEDMDLVTRLHLRMRERGDSDYRIIFVPDPVCWTEVPATLRVLARQRRRWQRGLLEVLTSSRRVFLNPRYGALGLFAHPFLFLFEGWGILIETGGYAVFLFGWWRGALDLDFLVAFLCAAFLTGMALSLAGVMLGEMTPQRYPKVSHWLRLIFFAFVENLGYRQMTTLLRLLGTVDFMRGRGEWGLMERRGLFKKAGDYSGPPPTESKPSP